jgi:hypothetical protein
VRSKGAAGAATRDQLLEATGHANAGRHAPRPDGADSPVARYWDDLEFDVLPVRHRGSARRPAC